MLVMGDKEVADGTVAVRARKEEKAGVKPVDAFIAELAEEIRTKAR
ncbi:MAG: His/Gly/Thr/Pro-type tRNA ligase C-terminal domain-containing protein [Oscillospiraceae bacterium]